MLINFQVTDKIIDESKGSCVDKCVVANMVHDVLLSPYSVTVGTSSVTIIYDGKKIACRIFLSDCGPISNFIHHFDRYKRQNEHGMIFHPSKDGVGWVEGPGRPPLLSFQLDIDEVCLKPEVVASVKNSGINGAVAIVEQQAALVDRLVSA